MVKLPQIQSRELFDLFQTVDQGVAVDKELPGGLGDVQVVLKELVDGEQGLLVKRIDGILLEHLAEEDLAQCGRQLVDQAADAQVFVVDDALFGVEHLAHVNGGLGFLVGIRQLAQMVGHGADADDGLDPQLVFQGVLHRLGDLLQVLGGRPAGDLLDDRHVAFVDGQDKVLHLVREHPRQHVHGGHVAVTHLPDEEHRPGGVGGKVQLLGADVNITGQDIVHDDILHKGSPVMLLLVEGLGIVQGDIGHLAEAPCHLVVAGAENGVFQHVGIAQNGLEAALAEGDDAVGGVGHLQRGVRPALTQNGHIGAGNHAPLGIDYAEAAVRNIPQLNNDTLKNAVGHIYSHSLVSCINAHSTKTHYYYTQLLRTLQVPFDILLQNLLCFLGNIPRFTGKRSLHSLFLPAK